jgi:hypothetical protein
MANNFGHVTNFFGYDFFLEMTEKLLADNKTTGSNQSEKYVFYTKLNFQRMQRWNKTFHLRADVSEQLRQLKPQIWWVITEAWCGDSAQCLPGIAKMAAAAEHIELRIILRDEYPEVMDKYLTNGTSRSIPKLVATDLEGNELFNWGPRPAAAQQMMVAWKAAPAGKSFEDFEKELHTWYAQDKGNALQDELLALMQQEQVTA